MIFGPAAAPPADRRVCLPIKGGFPGLEPPAGFAGRFRHVEAAAAGAPYAV